MSHHVCLPIPYIESLGRATVARYRFELVINTLISILERDYGYPRACHAVDPLESKLDHLASVPRSRSLRQDYWDRMRSIACAARELDADYKNAAISAVYSRGAGSLEEVLRALAERTNVSPVPRMTPLKIDVVARQFSTLTWKSSAVAESLLQMSERIEGHG